MSDSLRPPDRSTPGFPDLRYLLEFAQTHVHRVSDAIQPSHPLSLSSPAINLSQHWVFSCQILFLQGLAVPKTLKELRWNSIEAFQAAQPQSLGGIRSENQRMSYKHQLHVPSPAKPERNA